MLRELLGLSHLHDGNLRLLSAMPDKDEGTMIRVSTRWILLGGLVLASAGCLSAAEHGKASNEERVAEEEEAICAVTSSNCRIRCAQEYQCCLSATGDKSACADESDQCLAACP